MKIILATLFVVCLLFGPHLICQAAFPPVQAKYLKGCEEICASALTGFQENKYELLHSFFFQPRSYNARDIKYDKEYYISILKMIKQELGDLIEYSPFRGDAIPEKEWIWLGQSIFDKAYVSPDTGLYLKTYRAVFSKIREIPVYIYIYVYVDADRCFIRDLGVILPTLSAYGQDVCNSFSGVTLEKKKALFNILFLQERILTYYTQKYKRKILADSSADNADAVKYFLPTKEKELITLQLDYDKTFGLNGSSELQGSHLLPPATLQEGEQAYTVLGEEKEQLTIIFEFMNRAVTRTSCSVDPAREKGIRNKTVAVRSQRGYLVDFDLDFDPTGRIINERIAPRVHPFVLGGGLYVDYSELYWEEKKNADLNVVRKNLLRSLNLEQ